MAEVELRPLAAGDGPEIGRLRSETPDTGAVAFFSEFHHDPYQTLLALRPGSVGVAAVTAGRFVGVGLVTFGECWFEGEVRPSAYLWGLGVHPDYRRRGIASRIAEWRVKRAREHFRAAGRDGVMYAGIQSGNVGSVNTAASWATQTLTGRSAARVVKVRARPPRARSGLEVRPARVDELDRIAERQNAFFEGYNLYPIEIGHDLEAWRRAEVGGTRFREVLGAFDRSGDVVAGMAVMTEGVLITSHIVRMPTALRIANAFLRLIPTAGGSRALVDRFWFSPGQESAGRHLWESARWLYRDRATNVMTFLDPASPIRRIIGLPRFPPMPHGLIALSGPVPADPERPAYVNP